MAPKKRFVSEYKANFKEHEAHLRLQQQQIRNQERILNNPSMQENDVRNGLKGKSDKSTTQKENQALKYKAGLVPSMSSKNKLRYLSEYQKQFEWKRPVEREAPILSAEKMIYGGQDGNPSRATKINLPKKTEYQLQFVKHPLILTSPETKEKDQDKKQHLPLYSPVGYQDAQVAAGKPSKKAAPPIISKKSMVFQSEYHANFKSPSKYDYVKGSWVGADPPQFHPPDEQSDNGSQSVSSSWYQQVLELREKVRSYRSRARDGSHFLSLLKDLQNFEKKTVKESQLVNTEKTENLSEHTKRTPSGPANLPGHTKSPPPGPANQPGHSKSLPPEPGHEKSPYSESANLPGHEKTPPSEPSRKSNPVRTTQSKQQKNVLKYTITKDAMAKDESRVDKKENDPLPAADGKVSEERKLFWDKSRSIPGPSINTTHSLESISNESTISDASERNLPDEQTPVGRRHAWNDDRRGYHPHVVPPYYTSESSNGDQNDTRSDVTISDMEISSVVNDRRADNEHRVQATRKLFTGKREELGDDRKNIGDDRKLIGELPSNEKPLQATRKLFPAKRQGLDEGRRGSLSSDNEMSCSSHSFVSHSSSVLSVEAMDKRRALASETLQRAKRRQAQL